MKIAGTDGARGYIIVAASLFGISTGPAAFGLSSIGIVAEPLAQTFHWSRTEISLAVSVMMLCTAVSLPLAGRLIDRIGARRVLIPSIVLLALCMAGLSAIQAYWQFIALYVAMGTIAVGTNSTAYMRVISGWFDHRRGLGQVRIAGIDQERPDLLARIRELHALEALAPVAAAPHPIRGAGEHRRRVLRMHEDGIGLQVVEHMRPGRAAVRAAEHACAPLLVRPADIAGHGGIEMGHLVRSFSLRER